MEVMQKLSDDIYKNLYVTSDTHFNHNKEFVWKTRGYDSPEQMTEDMINIINTTVGENGILLHLGDFCLNTTKEQYEDILSKLKIKEIWMLWGNHNNPIQRNYGGTVQQICAINKGVFIRYLGHYFTFRKGKRMFVCCHFPLKIWDGQSDSSMHLHGHCHNNLLSSRQDDKTNKILDVGWDAFNRPLHINEIVDIMNTKNINSKHHDANLHLSP